MLIKRCSFLFDVVKFMVYYVNRRNSNICRDYFLCLFGKIILRYLNLNEEDIMEDLDVENNMLVYFVFNDVVEMFFNDLYVLLCRINFVGLVLVC